ncbi:hypothetical protein ACS0TY_034881 [Phlomoides rotata]
MASSKSYTPPCAACKLLRRKCMPGECIFSPYFPPQDNQKFANVRKIFGASNVAKHLSELPPHQRQDAVNSLAYEAEARVRDPVYGCVGVIATLSRQVQRLQKEVDAANADLIQFVCGEIAPAAAPPPVMSEFSRRVSVGGRFYQTPGMQIPYEVGWNDTYNPYDGGMGWDEKVIEDCIMNGDRSYI